MKAYSAAYLDKKSTEILNSFGLNKKSFHVTTCFDETGAIMNCSTVGFNTSTAQISDVVEWKIGDKIFLIALIKDCKWTSDINSLMKSIGAVELLEHIPHITLAKNCFAGESLKFKGLIGENLTFDCHSIKKML